MHRPRRGGRLAKVASTRYFHGTGAALAPGTVLEPREKNTYAIDRGDGVFLTDQAALAFFYAVLGPLQSGRFQDGPHVYEVVPEAPRANGPGEWVCESAAIVRDVTDEAKAEFKAQWSLWQPMIEAAASDPTTRRILLFEFERHTKTAGTGTLGPDGIVYRGYNLRLPPEVEAQVRRYLQPPTNESEIDQHLKVGPLLLDHLAANHWGGLGLGRHWTVRREMAETAAYVGGGWNVVVTARVSPDAVDPTDYPGENVSGEDEITLRPGAPVEVLNVEIVGDYTSKVEGGFLDRPRRMTASRLGALPTTTVWRGLRFYVPKEDVRSFQRQAQDPAWLLDTVLARRYGQDFTQRVLPIEGHGVGVWWSRDRDVAAAYAGRSGQINGYGDLEIGVLLQGEGVTEDPERIDEGLRGYTSESPFIFVMGAPVTITGISATLPTTPTWRAGATFPMREIGPVRQTVVAQKRASLADADLATGLLREPHDTLYPPVWGPDLKMRPEAKAAFLGRAYDAFTGIDVHGKLRFAVIGSGASYNWDEAGDLDIQVWCSDPDLVPALRKRIIPVNNPTCAELGLGETALMEVQFYVKPGGGTPEENLAGKPYACYDMNTDIWLLEPWPITPEFYAAAFANIEAEAEIVAQEVEDNLAEFHRAERAVAYWARFPEHADRHAAALLAYKAAHEALRAQFQTIFRGRADAYAEGGQGLHDERDSLVKILEVWGLWDDLKHIGQTPFGKLTKAAAKTAEMAWRVARFEQDGERFQMIGGNSQASIIREARSADDWPKTIVRLEWLPNGEIVWVQTDEAYRRKGLATMLFEYAKQWVPDLHHSTALSPDGEAWSRTVSKVALEVDHRSFKALLIDGRIVNVKRIERDGDQMWIVTTLDERIPSDRILTVNPQRVASVEDYGGAHQPGQAAPLTDLTEAMPADVYEHPEWYTGFTDRAILSETVRAINAARGNPSARVTIYRSAPPGVIAIDTGNWVSLSKAYATQHGLDAEDPEQDWPVYAAEVEARHVWFAGDDLMEFGYWGPPVSVRTARLRPRRGGYLAKVASAVVYEVTGPDSLGDFDVVARVGELVVGRLQGGKYNAVSRIFVDPAYRRRGIATEMYRRLEQAAGDMAMRRPDEFSDSGAAWYSQVGDKEVYPTWATEPDWSGWLRTAGAKTATVTSWGFGGDSVARGEYIGWVVAYVDGRPAGLFDYTVVSEEPDTLFIRNIEVQPEFRGRGIAQEMVDYVIAKQWTDWGKPAPKVDPGYLTDDGAKWWPKAKGRWRTAVVDEISGQGAHWSHEAHRRDRAGGAGDRRLAGSRARSGSSAAAGRGFPAGAGRGRRVAAPARRTIFVHRAAVKEYMSLDEADKKMVRRALKRYARGEQPVHALTGPFKGYVAIEIGSRLRAFVKESGMHGDVLGVGRHENFYAEMRRRLGARGLPVGRVAKVASPRLTFETTELDHDRGMEVRAITSAGAVAGLVRFQQEGPKSLVATRIWTAPTWRGKEVFKAIWEHLDGLGFTVDHDLPLGQDLLTAKVAVSRFPDYDSVWSGEPPPTEMGYYPIWLEPDGSILLGDTHADVGPHSEQWGLGRIRVVLIYGKELTLEIGPMPITEAQWATIRRMQQDTPAGYVEFMGNHLRRDPKHPTAVQEAQDLRGLGFRVGQRTAAAPSVQGTRIQPRRGGYLARALPSAAQAA